MVRDATRATRKSNATTRARAKAMRHDAVSMEALFWSAVRNRKLSGFKFKRQVPIGSYIADFVCQDRKLVVELDGPFHAARKDYDNARDAHMKSLGYCVLRFPNIEVAADLPIVLAIVKHELEANAPSPQPSPPTGEREDE